MAPQERRSLLKWAVRAFVYVTLAFGVYVAGYVVLMRRDLPAVDRNDWRFVYRSSFWFASSVTVCPPTTLWPAVSPMNVVFEPIDDCWRRACGFISAIPENEPFAHGQLDPRRIKAITVWINPREMLLAEKYEDLARCKRIEVPPDDATQELCRALRGRYSVGRNTETLTVASTIEASVDNGARVFLYFAIADNSEVYVCHPLASPARDPAANGRWQNDLLPWLTRYVLHEKEELGTLPYYAGLSQVLSVPGG